MNYFSTNNSSIKYTFESAVMMGLAPDGGLFMPELTPQLQHSFFSELKKLSFQEIGFEISKLFIENEITNNVLLNIINKAINFSAPLIHVNKSVSILELFHGPTLAFKDFGARFLANIISYFTKKNGTETNILVATSGDTGSAVASGFYGIEGVNVYLLYPSKKVSKIQEMQLTTLDKNVTALEVNGTFDDCQALVKKAFVDEEIISKKKLSSANSINIARLIPQTFYYFEAFKQINKSTNQVYISVPSGNLGNLTAGLIAKKMGLKITKFISALNSNNVFQNYLSKGVFEPRASVKTISNAMDVGNPSNFVRIQSLFNNNLNSINKNVSAYSFNDDETKKAIKKLYEDTGYIIDPHGAVGYLAQKKFWENKVLVKANTECIILETAHPSKFIDVVEKAISKKIEMPEKLKLCLEKEKNTVKISKRFADFKEYLITNK